MFRKIFVLGALAAAFASSAIAGAQTHPAVPEMRTEDGFSVRLPGEPGTPQRGSVNTPVGLVPTASWTTTTPDGALYSVAIADYPEATVRANPAQAFLDEGKNGLLNQIKGTVKAQHALTLAGVHPGQDFTLASPNGEVHARNYLVGRRLYILLVLYNPSVGAPGADDFLNSLKLTAPVTPVTPAKPGT